MTPQKPPKVTSYPGPPKVTSYPGDKGSQQYGPQASGPLPVDHSQEAYKYGKITPFPGYEK